jgi:hypothetical protein
MADVGSWLGRAGRNWGVMTALAALLFGAGGFAIGVSGPAFGVAVGAGIVAGPTQGGLVLLLAFLVAGLTGLVSLGLYAVSGRGPRTLGSIFFASVALLGGGFVGIGVGNAAHLLGWAPGPASSAIDSSHEAHATVTLALPGRTDFVPTKPAPSGDGSFGEWCSSEPGSFVLSMIDTLDVGKLGEYHLRVSVHITDPFGLFAQVDQPVPWVQVRATDDVRVVFEGPATVVEQTASAGRLRFEARPMEESQVGAGLPATLSGEVTWACGSWQGG